MAHLTTDSPRYLVYGSSNEPHLGVHWITADAHSTTTSVVSALRSADAALVREPLTFPFRRLVDEAADCPLWVDATAIPTDILEDLISTGDLAGLGAADVVIVSDPGLHIPAGGPVAVSYTDHGPAIADWMLGRLSDVAKEEVEHLSLGRLPWDSGRPMSRRAKTGFRSVSHTLIAALSDASRADRTVRQVRATQSVRTLFGRAIAEAGLLAGADPSKDALGIDLLDLPDHPDNTSGRVRELFESCRQGRSFMIGQIVVPDKQDALGKAGISSLIDTIFGVCDNAVLLADIASGPMGFGSDRHRFVALRFSRLSCR